MTVSTVKQPSFYHLLNDSVFISVLVAGRVRVGIEGHVGRDGVTGDEAGEGPDFREQTHFVDLK